MSTFSGAQGPGAMRRHKADLRLDAADRRAAFDHAVAERGRAQVLADRAAARLERARKSDRVLDEQLRDRDPAGQLLTEVFTDDEQEETP